LGWGVALFYLGVLFIFSVLLIFFLRALSTVNVSLIFRYQGLVIGDATWLELVGPRGGVLLLSFRNFLSLFFNVFFVGGLFVLGLSFIILL
jgi:hypothetical protein